MLAIEFGFFALCFGLLLSVYGLVLGLYSNVKPHTALISSSRNALIAVFICVFAASLTLWNALFSHDFSVKYVYLNSAANMPPVYLLTSFWSALEGSHLLWTLILSFVCAFSLCTVKTKNHALYPTLCVVFGLVLTFMLGLCVFVCSPVARLFPVPDSGLGMNALLQNPYMAIHPPCLFTGYSLLVVPFAYSIAALRQGDLSTDCLATIRRYTLAAWAVLLVAISLGGKWAYVELGWGGYWGWDPVENSSFMPWLATTAALHTYLIYSKLKCLPRMALFLSMLSFVLTFQGTFLTRSGIISSVHSFAQSNIGPAYLIWIVFLMCGSLFFLFSKGEQIEGATTEHPWGFSRESFLLFAHFFILFLLGLVFLGTIAPLVTEALFDNRISIQQPFFNAFAPWVGMGLVCLIGVGNLIKWRKGHIELPILTLGVPFFSALICCILIRFFHSLEWKLFFIYFVVLFNCGILIMDLILKLKKINWQAQTMLKHNRMYLGSLLAHIGFLIGIIGFSGNESDISAQVHLEKNQSTSFYGYTLTNKGLGYEQKYNAQYVIAQIDSQNQSTGEHTLIEPMRSKFANSEQWFHEVGVSSTFWHDLYLVMNSFDVKDESVSLKININPTVKLVWTSVVIMVLGALLSLTHRKKKKQEPEAFDGLKSQFAKSLSCLLVMTVLGLTAFGFSGLSYSQQDPSTTKTEHTLAKPDVPNAALLDVAKELRCPTCLGMSVMESDTPQSVAMRQDIERLLSQGKSKDEILSYFKKRYGVWILRKPDAQSTVGLLLWIFPIATLLLGSLFLFYKIKKSALKKGAH